MQTQGCNLCTGKERLFIRLKNGNPCVRCGGYGSISISCDNPVGTSAKDQKQIDIENGL